MRQAAKNVLRCLRVSVDVRVLWIVDYACGKIKYCIEIIIYTSLIFAKINIMMKKYILHHYINKHVLELISPKLNKFQTGKRSRSEDIATKLFSQKG